MIPNEYLESWNKLLSPKIQMTKSRELKLRSRMTNNSDFLKKFKMCLLKIKQSDFLSGRVKDWKATFDWLIINDNNFLKVLEGNYDNNKKGNIEVAKEWLEENNDK